MGQGIAIFFTDSIVVETWLGEDGLGKDIFSAAVTVKGYADQRRTMVRDADGEQVSSDTTVYTYLQHKDLFKPNSRVTVNGDTSLTPRVITTAALGVNSLRLPDHLAVSLG